MSKQLTIGLFGFGVVGEGIYEVLKNTPSLNAAVKKICIKDTSKKRSAPAELFTTECGDLLYDQDINLIVELIDDAEAAFTIVCSALAHGKAVVSANKKMIAEHVPHLLDLQKQHNTALLYEAAVCGSVPVIRNLEEYYDNDMLKGICGIVNGSTNFILTMMLEHSRSYKDSLMQAQSAGFAESNPDLDVSGRDAVNKLTILLLHAYGIKTHPSKIVYRGITSIFPADDAVFASEKDYKIKLVANAAKLIDGKIAAFVLPHFVTSESQLFNVSNEYNGVVIESKLADKQFLYGKGAGRYPTSSAVLSDIAALRYDYRYEYRKLSAADHFKLTDEFYLRLYVSFEEPGDVNKWDFESIEEFHSTHDRHYLIGLIHFERLRETTWIDNGKVSVIVMPDGIIEKREMINKSLKYLSLQLAGSK
jgi:homoserine dehydrogenase